MLPGMLRPVTRAAPCYELPAELGCESLAPPEVTALMLHRWNSAFLPTWPPSQVGLNIAYVPMSLQYNQFAIDYLRRSSRDYNEPLVNFTEHRHNPHVTYGNSDVTNLVLAQNALKHASDNEDLPKSESLPTIDVTNRTTDGFDEEIKPSESHRKINDHYVISDVTSSEGSPGKDYASQNISCTSSGPEKKSSEKSGPDNPPYLKFGVRAILSPSGQTNKHRDNQSSSTYHNQSTVSSNTMQPTLLHQPYPRLFAHNDFLAGASHFPPADLQLPIMPWIPGSARSKSRRGMLRRAVFSDHQRKSLEKMFQQQKYIGKPDRKRLAGKLGLKDSQVKIWFQNRRMKWRNSKERHILSAGSKEPQCPPTSDEYDVKLPSSFDSNTDAAASSTGKDNMAEVITSRSNDML
ncbi:unnamed protein product [Clavelina lepadiformis]|uniref:Homeobox domain-containing protein n=1 Tax=Clavelina lepadiformis TaxID=159417 RepID=A0ABP0FW21_CLALP